MSADELTRGADLARAADLTRAAVLGAGTMGRGIAQLLLQAGFAVTLVDPAAGALPLAREQLATLFERLAGKGRLGSAPAELLGRLATDTELEAAADAEWLFEAAPEDLELKRTLFARAAGSAPLAVLATNTSTLSVTAIAAGCDRPGDVVGMHFFNPPGVMRLVEVVPGMLTRPEVVATASALARRLGREPVVAKDSPGFIVNRLARPFYLEALRLHAAGLGVAQIDGLMRAAGFRQGPFELLDLIGLDVNLAASLGVYRAFFEEPRYRPHPLQQAMVTAGLLGRKTGRGFYRYDSAGRRLADEGEGPPPATAALRGAAPLPKVLVVGDTSAARALRSLLHGASLQAGPGVEPSQVPDLVLDARLAPPGEEIAPLLARGGTVAVLTWGRSASSALAASRPSGPLPAGGALLGFSLLPGAPGARPRVELMAPRAADVAAGASLAGALEAAAATLAAAGAEVEVVPDTAGGVAFRIVALLVNEAVGALADGLAGRGEMDLAMRLGVNYPLGPLEWAERIGLGELHAALRGIHAETLESRFAPHPWLTQLAAVGAETFPEGRAGTASGSTAPSGPAPGTAPSGAAGGDTAPSGAPAGGPAPPTVER